MLFHFFKTLCVSFLISGLSNQICTYELDDDILSARCVWGGGQEQRSQLAKCRLFQKSAEKGIASRYILV